MPMMNMFRRGGAGSWIVAVIATIIIVVFVIEFRTARGPTGGAKRDDCAIEVYDQCVSHKDFFASYLLVTPHGVSSKRLKDMKLVEQIIEGLVERELLVHEAKRLGMGVSDEQLEFELTSGRAHASLPAVSSSWLGMQLGLCLPTDRMEGCPASSPMIRLLPVRRARDNQFDPALYERTIRSTMNRGPKQYREMQYRELLAMRLRNLVEGSVRVSQQEAFAAYERANAKAVTDAVGLDRNWFAKYVVDSSAAAIESWAGQNRAQVDEAYKNDQPRFKAGCPRVSEILLPVASDATDEEKVKARTDAEKALERLTKGKEPFEVVARQMSRGDAALAGGSLGCLDESYGVGAKELLQEAGQLAAGKLSGILETPRGFHILRSEGPLAEADVEAQGRLYSARRIAVRLLADDATRKFADGLRARAGQGESLEQAVQELIAENLVAAKSELAAAARADQACPKVERSMPFTIDGTPGAGISPFSGIGAKVFALSEPNSLVPESIVTQKGVAVVALVKKEPAERADFDKEPRAWSSQLRERKSRDALIAYVGRLRKAASSTIRIDASLKDIKMKGSDD